MNEWVGMGILALAILAGIGWLIWTTVRTERNDGSTHGGGPEERTPFTEQDVY